MAKQNISDRKLSLGERVQLAFIPLLIALIQRLYGLTLRRIDIGREKVEELRREKKPWIYAIWHTNVLFSPYMNRGQGVNVLISASRDGELIYRVVRHFGNRAIRGSSSRGGIRALKMLVDSLKAGQPAAVTPDGPRGPAFKLQEGIITAAYRSGAPIVPFHYEATRQWVAEKAWDKHRVPKPFSTVVVSYGEPIYLSAGMKGEEFAAAAKDVERRLLENMERCQAKVRELRGAAKQG